MAKLIALHRLQRVTLALLTVPFSGSVLIFIICIFIDV